MADAPPGPTSNRPKAEEWQLPSWKKIGEFVGNVMWLERSVETLKEQNKRLQEEMSRIQRQADDQAGQLKVLLRFVQASFSDQVETHAEKAVHQALGRLIAFQGDEPPEG